MIWGVGRGKMFDGFVLIAAGLTNGKNTRFRKFLTIYQGVDGKEHIFLYRN